MLNLHNRVVVQWQSNQLEMEGSLFESLPKALCCVLEQDILCLVLVQPRKFSEMTENSLTGM